MKVEMFKRNAYYVLVPLFYIAVAAAGRLFTAEGVSEWYPTLAKPSYTPPGSFIGAMWSVIYVLTAASLILYTDRAAAKDSPWPVVGVYIFNGAINAAWSWIFFTRHMAGLAVLDAALIWATVLVMMVLVWPRSRAAGILLVPYLAWTAFATFLNYQIYRLN